MSTNKDKPHCINCGKQEWEHDYENLCPMKPQERMETRSKFEAAPPAQESAAPKWGICEFCGTRLDCPRCTAAPSPRPPVPLHKQCAWCGVEWSPEHAKKCRPQPPVSGAREPDTEDCDHTLTCGFCLARFDELNRLRLRNAKLVGVLAVQQQEIEKLRKALGEK